MDYLLLPILSFFIGMIVGITGIGGASLITPMLIFCFHVPPSIAISSDVVAATLMKIVGSWKHWQQKTLDVDLVKWLAMGSVSGSLLGIAVLYQLRNTGEHHIDSLLLRLLGVMIVIVTFTALIQMLLVNFFPKINLPQLPTLNINTNKGRLITVIIGAILGFCVGMTSVSSGSMFALVLTAFFRLDARKLVGTDITQAAILLIFTSLGHLTLGTVNFNLVIPIWIGSVPGVIIGAKICEMMPQGPLRFTIYGILMMISWKLVQA
ncbi:MAG: sulfite exporter TauE/SafE family protein [Dolichospermum sp.]